ncbi:MAG: PD-(D/E)XK nuclease family protein [Bdellovibrionales bacterium]|nr:PD-(D/E)XK nuclease family protein [Bdellovibrionales bacterium]
MLKKIEISTFEDRIPYLKSSSKKGIYIVSDIKSKIQFQNFFLEEDPHFQTDFIQRASDFYCEIFKYNYPDYHIISSSYLELLFKIYIQKTNHSWLKNIPSYQTILHSLHTFLPFFIHPEGANSFETWTKQTAKKSGWVQWYEPTKMFWEDLKKNKLIEKSLVKYSLTDQTLQKWKNPLTIDLSFSIDSVEAGLISTLSSTQDVTLLIPPELDNPLYSKSHYNYSLVGGSHQKRPRISKKNLQINVRKFQTMLEETRFVTEQLSLALNNGLKPSDLAVLAPDMELYWPCLKNYLKRENIPVKKGSRISLLSFPQIQKWISILHFYSGKISFENMTALLNSNQSHLDISKIKSKYYYCDRSKDIKNFPYAKEKKPKTLLSTEEFTDWIHGFWDSIINQHPNKKLNECVSTILHRISSSGNVLKQVEIENWLEILESELMQEEFHIPSTKIQGVELLSINAITSLRAKQVFIMGLDHNSCHTSSKTFLNEQESKQILQDLGFHCLTRDPSQTEYEVVHFLNSFEGSTTLSYSETGFDGSSLTPSRIWLMKNVEANYPPGSKPTNTSWSTFQQKPLEEIVKNSAICSADQIQQILDQNLKWPASQKTQVTSLSPSKMKDYASCPFIFLSKNIFHLKDISYQDMDLDYKDYGQIIHELFHQVKKGKIQSKQDIFPWIQSIKSDFHILSDNMWQSYSQQFVEKYLQFIEHEKKITRLLTEIKTTDTEWNFELYWNLEKEDLDPSKGDILIKGRIDRIDYFQDEYLIIDYKASLNNIVNISHWENNLDFQMPLYIGAVSLLKDQGTVSASLYLSYRDFKWKGFISKNSELKKIAHPSRITIDLDKKDIILKNINKSIQKNILNLKENIFTPTPIDKKICANCYWRNICRAPHLN